MNWEDKVKLLKNKIRLLGIKTGLTLIALSSPAHGALTNTSNVFNGNLEKHPELDIENVRFMPEEVKTDNNLIEFHNWAYYNGAELADYKGATEYSLWDVSYKRETGSQKNPVGVVGTFYGSLQFNRFNAVNMAIYGLLNPKYTKLCHKFFQTNKKGFHDALDAFTAKQKQLRLKNSDVNLAYHVGSGERKLLANYVVPNFRSLFEKEGLENTIEFLQLQRDYAGAVYCSFDAKNLNKIINTLEQQNIKPEEVNPAIWGMFLAKHIKGGFGNIASLLRGKTIDEINSESFVNQVANAFPDVFKTGSGKDLAYPFAKAHCKDKHSLTTIRELSLILNKPEIFDNYVQYLAFNHNGLLDFHEAAIRAQDHVAEVAQKNLKQDSSSYVSKQLKNNEPRDIKSEILTALRDDNTR